MTLPHGSNQPHQVEALGAIPVKGNYTVREDLDRAFAESGAKMVFIISDFFKAAKGKIDVEIAQGQVGRGVGRLRYSMDKDSYGEVEVPMGRFMGRYWIRCGEDGWDQLNDVAIIVELPIDGMDQFLW